jgi:hypothetical protein
MKTLVLILLSVFAFQGCASLPFGKLQEEQKFKDYTVRIYRDEDAGSGCFEILKSSKQVYFHEGFKFKIGNIIFDRENRTNTWLKIGQSITRDKQPNLVVSEWTGGAHCCFIFYIFQIGDRFKMIDTINTEHGGDSDFKDLRHDGDVELVTHDWTFAYWNASFAQSPAPAVILRCEKGKYRPDLEMMRKAAPTAAELDRMAEGFRQKFKESANSEADNPWSMPPELWGKMLELIYTGNAKSAWKLLDLSWPAEKSGKNVFLSEFVKQLSTSPYCNTLFQPSFQSEP